MISKCICDGSKVDQCIDLGSIPLVNNFKKKIQLKKYSLSMGLCRKCKLFQIQKILNLNYYLIIMLMFLQVLSQI